MINNPLTKTLTFAAVHFTVAFTVAYLLTGSVLVGGLLALVEPMLNTFAYHLHEKAWARIRNRRNGTDATHGFGHGLLAGA
jgi:uncharacterized membrane protein